jgi:hypothetical protein
VPVAVPSCDPSEPFHACNEYDYQKPSTLAQAIFCGDISSQINTQTYNVLALNLPVYRSACNVQQHCSTRQLFDDDFRQSLIGIAAGLVDGSRSSPLDDRGLP